VNAGVVDEDVESIAVRFEEPVGEALD